MSKPIDRIKYLLSSLPEKDIHFGHRFLEDRDFESLKDLVDSAIYIVRKNLKCEEPKEEYVNIDLGNLSMLKSEVDLYMDQLITVDCSIIDNYEDDDLEESYY